MTVSQQHFEAMIAAAQARLPRVLAADPSVQPVWRAARWRLAQAPATFVDNSCPAYLQIDLDFHGSADDNDAAAADDDDDNMEEEDDDEYLALALDNATASPPLLPDALRDHYRVQIDVVLHSMYRVPCPYVRVFTATGQSVPAERSLVLLTQLAGAYGVLQSSADGVRVWGGAVAGAAGAAGGGTEYGVEEHPLLQTPCLCVHVCGVGECMAALTVAGGGGGGAGDGDEEEEGEGGGPYMARWLALVGPALGLRMTPHLFVAAVQEVEEVER